MEREIYIDLSFTTSLQPVINWIRHLQHWFDLIVTRYNKLLYHNWNSKDPNSFVFTFASHSVKGLLIILCIGMC